jgi:molybdopterin-containing oxidoreductase family iron-sulfur binding subunit
MEKKYWKSIEELGPGKPASLAPEEEPVSPVELLAGRSDKLSASRRDFLKWCGISFVSATVLSACENPVKKAIPYLNQPEELVPGMASWYASTFMLGNEYCPVLVRNRDGRPIKIEGNPLSSITGGGTSARVQASVLSLYDSGGRYREPLKKGAPVSWDEADRDIIQQLMGQDGSRRKVLLTPTLLSPSTRALINEAVDHIPGLEVVIWDPVSYAAIREAHRLDFGQAVIPSYRFGKASLVIGFSADFLGTWLSPIEFARDYATRRRPLEENAPMSRHIQFESRLSLTGANADERIPLKPSEEKQVLLALHDALARATGSPSSGSHTTALYDVDVLARDILEHHGNTLVVCGHDDTDMQGLVNAINHMAGSYGTTIDPGCTYHAGQSDEKAFEQLVEDMKQGQVAALLCYRSNPLYHYHDPEGFLEGLKQTALSVSFATTKDETALACDFVLPDHHYLEAWNDASFKTGSYSLAQPLIHPLFSTRSFQDGLLQWLGREEDFHGYIRTHWEEAIFPQQSTHLSFESFWVESLQSGIHENPATEGSPPAYNASALPAARERLADASLSDGLEYEVYAGISLGDGTDANNPWLQELPDPVSSVTWDNFAAVAPETAQELGLAEGDRLRINDKLSVPVLIQPGQAAGCLSIALGYGRTHAGKSADNRGGNAFLLYRPNGNGRLRNGSISQWVRTGSGHAFARTQTHFSMEGRAIVRESTLDKYREDPAAGNELRAYHLKHMNTLYPEVPHEGHHWALMVDLNACTGCSACVIACQSENNIPVIGQDQVRRRRIMHWMRIDRYYTGDAANPGVVFQPLMCQHCDHAPCENVCPVAATTHSQEGINQITYNRCVGTKYCINNCPYKVRRFNWYEYATREKFNTHTTTELGRMVLNPDVTVRERGVVEKCSFCVQRIQEAKLRAKNEKRRLRDGEIRPACLQACPTGALVFGDLNDKDSRVSQLIRDPRNYHLLEELHTLPSVGYLTKIRNPKETNRT